MATIRGYTSERMKEIEDNTVIGGTIVDGHLMLAKFNGELIDAGLVAGPQGPPGPDAVPTGGIISYGGLVAPTGYLLCEGQPVARDIYDDLFLAIGIKWGAGNGLTTFNVPNGRGCVLVGMDLVQVEFNDVGKGGGAKEVVLTEGQMPTHFHGITRSSPGTYTPGNNAMVSTDSAGGWDRTSDPIGTATSHIEPRGLNEAHTNLQPFKVVNYIIKT